MIKESLSTRSGDRDKFKKANKENKKRFIKEKKEAKERIINTYVSIVMDALNDHIDHVVFPYKLYLHEYFVKYQFEDMVRKYIIQYASEDKDWKHIVLKIENSQQLKDALGAYDLKYSFPLHTWTHKVYSLKMIIIEEQNKPLFIMPQISDIDAAHNKNLVIKQAFESIRQFISKYPLTIINLVIAVVLQSWISLIAALFMYNLEKDD